MRLIPIIKGFILSLIAACLAGSALAKPFPWPDSRTHTRVLLYADQGIADYIRDHPEWFADDFLLAGLYISKVPYGDSDKALHQFSFLFNQFHHKHIFSGTYVSGTTALREFTLSQYPANAVSIEDLSVRTHYLGTWLRDANQQVVDLQDPKSRNELQSAIRDLWRHLPVPMRFVDNAAVHPRVANMQKWTAYCDNMAGLRAIAESGQANAIFNVFARPWEMSEAETKQLITAVAGNGGNGVSFPLPWSKSIKDDKNAQGWAAYRYRQLLDRRIAVILIPSDDAPQNDLYLWVSTWRRPGDRIYFATPFWEVPPG